MTVVCFSVYLYMTLFYSFTGKIFKDLHPITLDPNITYHNGDSYYFGVDPVRIPYSILLNSKLNVMIVKLYIL